MGERIKAADTYFYLKGTDYKGLIGSYAAMKALKLSCEEDEGKDFEGGWMERNHLIPASFFEHGPKETKHLCDYVPTLPLQRKEHRGSAASKSFHHMKRFGINDYLKSKGLSIRKSAYSSADVAAAIDACREWYAKIGMTHAVEAIDEFKERFYSKAARHGTTAAGG